MYGERVKNIAEFLSTSLCVFRLPADGSTGYDNRSHKGLADNVFVHLSSGVGQRVPREVRQGLPAEWTRMVCQVQVIVRMATGRPRTPCQGSIPNSLVSLLLLPLYSFCLSPFLSLSPFCLSFCFPASLFFLYFYTVLFVALTNSLLSLCVSHSAPLSLSLSLSVCVCVRVCVRVCVLDYFSL